MGRFTVVLMASELPVGTQGNLTLSFPIGNGYVSNSQATRCGSLPVGMRCRYHSERFGWLECKVLSCNETNGTYNLDVREHASVDKIAPLGRAGSGNSCI